MEHRAKLSGRRRHKHKPGDEALCKYASKACYKPRVAKKTGELHRYCDHHRQQANRNQRRLELRRRLRGHDEGYSSSPSPGGNRSVARFASCGAKAAYPSDGSLSDSSLDDTVTAAELLSHAPVLAAAFEPFRDPVELHAEDLTSLLAIFSEPTEPSADTWSVEMPSLCYQLMC